MDTRSSLNQSNLNSTANSHANVRATFNSMPGEVHTENERDNGDTLTISNVVESKLTVVELQIAGTSTALGVNSTSTSNEFDHAIDSVTSQRPQEATATAVKPVNLNSQLTGSYWQSSIPRRIHKKPSTS